MAGAVRVRMTPREKRILAYVSLAHAANHTLDITYAAVLGVPVLAIFNVVALALTVYLSVAALARSRHAIAARE